MKKLSVILLLFAIALLSAMGFVACSAGDGDTRNGNMVRVYNAYVVYAEENGETPLTYER